MKAHRACLFMAAAFGAVVLFGCASMPQTSFDKAKALQNDGKYAQAISKYKDFIGEKEYPAAIPFASYEIARCYRSEKKNADAMDWYKKTIDQYDPKSLAVKWSREEMDEMKKAPAMMSPGMPPPKSPAPGTTSKY